MECPHCGTDSPTGNRFCGWCGEALRGAERRRAGGASPRDGVVAEPPGEGYPATGRLPLLEEGKLVGGRFRVGSFVGRGGFGAVYRAEDTRLDRCVALKVMPMGEGGARFRREAQSLAALNHPAVVTIYDAGEEDGLAYIAMEFVEGESLAQRLRRPLPAWDETAEIFLQVAAGLEHAHERGMVHRDVKPANILLAPTGEVKVTDLGVARVLDATPLTEEGVVFGTLEYVAPELLADRPAEPRSDVYSLGVCFFEALTGRLPLTAASPQSLIRKVLHEDPPPLGRERPDLPAALQELVDACLRKDPARRPASAREVRLTLHELLHPPEEGREHRFAVTVPVRLSTRVLRPEVEGERKRVVILVVRERHIPDLLEDRPAEEVRRIRAAYLEQVFPVVEAQGGKVEEVGEEEFVVLFGLPFTTERDEESALRCAVALRDAIARISRDSGHDLRLSMGVHVGHAISTPGADSWLVRGAALRLARRLSELGGAGEVLASRAVEDRASSRFRFIEAGEVPVSGREATTRSFRLGPSIASGPIPISPERGLVGRHAELGFLEDAAVAGLRGPGQVVSITGEAGVGKSRLVEAFVAGLPDLETGDGDRPVLVAVQGGAHEAALPYQGAAELARALLPVASPDAGTDRDRIAALERSGLPPHEAEVLRGLLRLSDKVAEPARDDDRAASCARALRALLGEACRSAPLVLVLEDLHWFDPASLETIREVLRAVPSLPACAVAVYRPGFRTGFGELRNHQVIDLGPLRPDEEEELVRRFLEIEEVPDPLRALLAERTGGNPLYTVEFLRMLLERGVLRCEGGEAEIHGRLREAEVPASIEGVLGARVDRLGAETRRLLQLASVLGREFPASWLREVWAGRAEFHETLERLARGGILHETRERGAPALRFDHPLTRDVVYANILRGSRRRFHRIAAEAMEKLHPDRNGETMDILAHHWGLSDRPEAGIRALAEAAALNRAGYRNEAAIRQYGEAIALAAPGHPRRFELLAGRCAVLAFTGRNDEARRDAAAALAIALKSADREGEYEARLALGHALEGGGALEEAAAEFAAAAEAAGRDASHRAGALLKQARVDNMLGRSREALRVLDTAKSLLPESGEPDLHADLHTLRGWSLYDLGVRRVAAKEEAEALGFHERQGDRNAAAQSRYRMGIYHIAGGDYEEAFSQLAECEREAREIGASRTEAISLYAAAYARIQRGDLDEGSALLGRMELTVSRSNLPWHHGDSLRLAGVLATLRGEYDRALSLLKEARSLKKRSGDRREMGDCDLALARLHLDCGRPDTALALAETVELGARDRRDPFQRCEAETVRAAVYLALGEPELARRAAAEAEAIARRYAEPETLLPALLVRASLTEGEETWRLVEEVLAAAVGTGRRLDEAWGLLRRGELRLEEGDALAASKDFTAAVRIGSACGVPEIVWRGEARLEKALAALEDTEGSLAARAHAASVVARIASRIGNADLSRSYREEPVRSAYFPDSDDEGGNPVRSGGEENG